jgi:nitrite reductase (cytochrome c-552)
MTQRQICTKLIQRFAPPRKPDYPRAVAGACAAAFAAILLFVPATGTTQSATHPSAERQLGGPTFNDNVEDPAQWGKAFPKHYEYYKKSIDMQRTKHGGSEAVPQSPTKGDPRSVVARSKVEEDPGLKAMWQGYAFSEDFREERGHYYMLEDQRLTKRQVVVKQPGACVNCHASMYLAYKKAGNGDIVKGFDKINAMPYQEASKLVSHPVACIDCHDGKTLALRVTRPAFIEGLRAYKASLGVKDYDVNKQASTAEMRAYVCGQCHVEYYFKGPEKSLVYPWSKGLRVEQIIAYYDDAAFVTGPTRTPALPRSRRNIPNSRPGARARTLAPGSRAWTATCRRSRRRSPTTGCAARS